VRLLYVSRRYWPAVGGVETFLRHVAQELSPRHSVTVLALRTDEGPTTPLSDSLAPSRPFDPFLDGDVQVVPLRISHARRALMTPLLVENVPVLRRYAHGRMRGLLTACYAHAVAPVIAKYAQEADIIHAWAGDLIAAGAVRAARLVRVPSVVMASIHPGQWGDDAASAVTYRAATTVIAQLEAEAAVYRRLGVPEDRIALCGACAPAVASGGGKEIRRRFGIEGPLVLFLGVRRPYKGVDILLEAAPRVAKHRRDVTFVFVGPGPRVIPPAPHVRIVDAGTVSEVERASWLNAADVLCLPSAGESFGIAVLEAWSASTPVIVSDAPALRELVAKSNGGVSVRREPQAIANALIELLGSPDRLMAMAAAGHSYWESHYTVAAVSEWHEQLYASLVQSPEASLAPASKAGARSDSTLASGMGLSRARRQG
jgi:glycosyltransferase involved in cell wall biosynthesis